MELAGAGGGELAFWAVMLAEVVATAAGPRMGRGAKAADCWGLTSAGKSPDTWTVKKSAAGKTENRVPAHSTRLMQQQTSQHMASKWNAKLRQNTMCICFSQHGAVQMTQTFIKLSLASNSIASWWEQIGCTMAGSYVQRRRSARIGHSLEGWPWTEPRWPGQGIPSMTLWGWSLRLEELLLVRKSTPLKVHLTSEKTISFHKISFKFNVMILIAYD